MAMEDEQERSVSLGVEPPEASPVIPQLQLGNSIANPCHRHDTKPGSTDPDKVVDRSAEAVQATEALGIAHT
jgi:hypothetical protein